MSYYWPQPLRVGESFRFFLCRLLGKAMTDSFLGECSKAGHSCKQEYACLMKNKVES